MPPGALASFGAHLKMLREAAGFTQEELATISGLSVHAISALERGERRRPQLDTVRALSAALDLSDSGRNELLRRARAPAPSATPEFAGATLPIPPTALVGRADDVQVLLRWLADPAVRLITILGPGGVGKTRLALEVARAVEGDGAVRVAFAHLAPIDDTGLVACAIAEALGLAEISATELPRRARAACASSETLLVLDNFEQVLKAAPLVAEVLTAAGRLRVIVTSRAALRVRGEREYALGPLASSADAITAFDGQLARIPAVQLFVERVRDVKPGFQLTADNALTVTSICRRLDALPLALELAAPWIKVLAPADLLRRLEQDVLLPTEGPRDLPARQQTMNATVAWSYQLLSPEEQRMFRRLSALPGRFSLEAAAALQGDQETTPVSSGEALGPLVGLLDKSLLFRIETSVESRPLYQMFETVRAYAARELTAAGERDAAREAVANFFLREATFAAAGLVASNQAEWLDRVRDDLENYREAMFWLIERGRPDDVSRIAWSLLFFWLIRGYAAEGLWWCEQILKFPSLSPLAESQSLVAATLMRYSKGDLAGANDALERALDLAHSAGDREMAAHAENLHGHVDQGLGNVDKARERFARTVENYRTLALPWGVGSALNGMASVALAGGDVGRAERLLNEATAALADAGPYFMTSTLYVRAILAIRRGNPDEAIAIARESLHRVRAIQDRFAFVYALLPLAVAASLKGDDLLAARILGARDMATERTGATVADQTVVDLRQQAEKTVRDRLSAAQWEEAYEAGRASSLDSLLGDLGDADD
jgi:predicted ATPase/DNA-binding XRE family transcriptional regulator